MCILQSPLGRSYLKGVCGVILYAVLSFLPTNHNKRAQRTWTAHLRQKIFKSSLFSSTYLCYFVLRQLSRRLFYCVM